MDNLASRLLLELPMGRPNVIAHEINAETARAYSRLVIEVEVQIIVEKFLNDCLYSCQFFLVRQKDNYIVHIANVIV